MQNSCNRFIQPQGDTAKDRRVDIYYSRQSSNRCDTREAYRSRAIPKLSPAYRSITSTAHPHLESSLRYQDPNSMFYCSSEDLPAFFFKSSTLEQVPAGVKRSSAPPALPLEALHPTI